MKELIAEMEELVDTQMEEIAMLGETNKRLMTIIKHLVAKLDVAKVMRHVNP